MIIRNINTKIVFSSFIILIWTFCIHSQQITAQNQIQQNPNQPLMNLLNQIEQQMVKHNQDILTNNLTHPNDDFNNIKKNLKILIDVFMPLAERLKVLQKQERTILHKTQNLADQYIPLTPKEQKTKNQNIIEEQLVTRNDTQKTRDIIVQQKNSIATSNTKPQSKTIDTINQLSDYIGQALKNENQALNHLHNNELKQAISEEKKALEQIEKALKLISPPQAKNNQKQDQQAKNNQNQKQDQQAKKNQNQKQASEKKADQQLSAEEALKLLAQLQKKAEDERKKRKKEYGVTLSPQQLPVEKDW